MVKQKTWKLIYPNGEESIFNYNPIEEERKATINEVEHKHQVSMQCARDASREEALREIFDKFDEYACIKDDKWYKELKLNLLK